MKGSWLRRLKNGGQNCGKFWQRRGGEKGDRDCEATNNKKSGSRTCQTLKVGDWVVWEVQKRNSKLGERWERTLTRSRGLMRRGGYSLQEMDGRLLKDLTPIKHLKVVEKALDKEQAYEVEKLWGTGGR